MEILSGKFTLTLAEGSFPLSTDSMVLADFVKLPRTARVLDLGSGCGTLGLLLCAKDDGCTVPGLDLTENAHLCALQNIRSTMLDHAERKVFLWRFPTERSIPRAVLPHFPLSGAR